MAHPIKSARLFALDMSLTVFHPLGHDLYDVGARGRLGTIPIALLSHVTFLAKHTPRVNEQAFCR